MGRFGFLTSPKALKILRQKSPPLGTIAFLGVGYQPAKSILLPAIAELFPAYQASLIRGELSMCLPTRFTAAAPAPTPCGDLAASGQQARIYVARAGRLEVTHKVGRCWLLHPASLGSAWTP
jgi:hypothetical protein